MTPDIQQAFEDWWAKQGIKGMPTDMERSAYEAGYDMARNGPSTPHSVAFKAICPPAGEKAPITAETVYNAYPRKVGKQAAIKAITKAAKQKTGGFLPVAVTRHGPAVAPHEKAPIGLLYLLNRTEAYAKATASWPEADRQYIPHPATWFNRGSYDDDPKEWERGSVQASQFSQAH